MTRTADNEPHHLRPFRYAFHRRRSRPDGPALEDRPRRHLAVTARAPLPAFDTRAREQERSLHMHMNDDDPNENDLNENQRYMPPELTSDVASRQRGAAASQRS